MVDAEFFQFTTSENITLNGYMMKPANFDPKKKYPVFMYVYGGPGSQTVTDSYGGFNYFWFQMLTQKGYIVVSVDNRGTGARGRDFRAVTYENLGKYETMDQIEAARWLGKQSYVDASRIGIFGWSYGGYMTALCMTKGADVFNAGISVAPVSNWKYYDNIYTERYMGTLETNPNGFDINSPTSYTDLFKGEMLLVHGTGDDNVHWQNSAELINALVKSNKQFDLMIYPNRNHGIYGGTTRLNLYTKMTNFLLENL
jgi:dipeptidyl-peptidase 4